MVVESRSVKRNAKNARRLGRDTAPFPKSCSSYFRFARFNTFPLYYLRAWHRLLLMPPEIQEKTSQAANSSRCKKRLKWKIWEIAVLQPPQWIIIYRILECFFCLFVFFHSRSCLVPRPHYSARPKRFGSRGPSQNMRHAHSVFSRRLPPVPLGSVTEVNWPRGTGKTPYRKLRMKTMHWVINCSILHAGDRDVSERSCLASRLC